MKKPTFGEKLKYGFDKRMARGSAAMIKMLAIATLIVAVIIAVIITLSGSGEDDFLYNFWDSLATVINAWMPASEDGGVLYIVLTALAAIMGLFVTSVLIGIVGSAIEDKINDLRKGNSKVLESGHIVVLGSVKGEYELIKQLVLSYDGRKGVIVIGDEFERDEYEEVLFENVELPKNVKIICRSVDAASPVSLECLSIPTARTLIVNFSEDEKTIRAILAARKLLENYPDSNVSVVASVSNEQYMLPDAFLKEKNTIMLKTDSIIAGIISRSLCQEGISGVLTDIFDYEGSEFYVEANSYATGKTFGTLFMEARNATIVGIERDGDIIINPSRDFVIGDNDRLVFFAEDDENLSFEQGRMSDFDVSAYEYKPRSKDTKITIIGCNEKIDNICREMPESVVSARVITDSVEEADRAGKLIGADKKAEITINVEDIDDIPTLEKIAVDTNHIVLLTDDRIEPEDADLKTMMTLMRLRDIKKRLSLDFQITAEIQRESNRVLMAGDDNTDFVVALNMVALAMAQVAVEPVLYGIFKSILSVQGNEIMVKAASDFGMKETSLTAGKIKRVLIDRGYIFMGYINEGETTINPGFDEAVPIGEDTLFVVVGDN